MADDAETCTAAERLIRGGVRALQGYAPGEQPRDADYVKLNTNENPYPPSPRVLDALGKVDAHALRRYPDPVCAELRERIAGMHGCDTAQIFVGNGSDEILALCTRAFVENDGSIGYFDPSYSLYPVLAEIRGVDKQPVGLGPEFEWPVSTGHEWRLPSGYRCSLFFFANPNAPTGMLCAREAVRAFCARFPNVVVLDEAYVDFACEDNLQWALETGNVLATRSLSKSFSLAGLRVGYAVGSRALIAALFKIKDSYNVDALAARLALAALQDVDAMRRNAERVKAARRRLSAALAERGHQVYPSEANFVWVKPRGIGANDLFHRLRERRILVRYFAGERTGDCLRITVGTEEQIDRLLEGLRAAEEA